MANPKSLKPFAPGDPRINRKGRPKNFDQLRALAKMIANEVIEDKDKNPLGVRVELILRNWFVSPDPRLQIQAMNIAYGKVPDTVELGGKGDEPIKHHVVIEYADMEIDPDGHNQDSSTETT